GNGGITLITHGAGTMGGAGTLDSTGNLTVTVGTGAANLLTNVASLTPTTNGAGGNVSVAETNGLILNAGSIGAGALNVTNTAGNITVGTIAADTITADGGITLLVNGASTISGNGTLASTGGLTVTSNTGNMTLNTNVGSLTATSTSGNLSVVETNALTINASNVGSGSFSVDATAGNITVGGNVTGNGGITLITHGAGTMGGAGTLNSTGNLAVTVGTGAANLLTNVASLTPTTNGAGGYVSVAETNGLILNA